MPGEHVDPGALIGMVQALDTPGNCRARSVVAISFWTVLCGVGACSSTKLSA
jgi:hypothetical protein